MRKEEVKAREEVKALHAAFFEGGTEVESLGYVDMFKELNELTGWKTGRSLEDLVYQTSAAILKMRASFKSRPQIIIRNEAGVVVGYWISSFLSGWNRLEYKYFSKEEIQALDEEINA